MPALRLPMIVALCTALGIAPPPLAAQKLRVMTFNVRLPSPGDGANRWEKRRDVMVQVIRRQHPDVLGTQELYKIQGDYLVSQLPGYRWFGRGRLGDDRDEHMGVFYRTDRLTIKESGDFWLSDTPEKPGSISWGHPYPRMVTWALFEVKPGGCRFYYYNTHLPYREQDELARTRGAGEILDRLQALPASIPIVLSGDFNTTPDSPTHALLTGSLHDAWRTAATRTGPEATFHDFTGIPDHRIDWILYRGFYATGVHTITTQQHGNYPSDHFPVAAELVGEKCGAPHRGHQP